jgi:hypothetical protein
MDVGVDKAGEDIGGVVRGAGWARVRRQSAATVVDRGVMDWIRPASMVTTAGYIFCLRMSTNLADDLHTHELTNDLTRINAKFKTLLNNLLTSYFSGHRKPSYMYLSRILLVISFFLGAADPARASRRKISSTNIYRRWAARRSLQSINSLYQEGDSRAGRTAHSSASWSWRVYDRVYREEIVMATGKVVIVVTPSRAGVSVRGRRGSSSR